MITGIDHLVILVRDLEQAIADYARLGFTVIAGGEHADGSTHNALVIFADGAYLELIAFKQPDKPSNHPWWPFLAMGEGLIAYALGSDNVTLDAEQLASAEWTLQGPRDGGRLRLDGERVAWRTLGVGPGPLGTRFPFLIEDITPRALRVPGGEVREHKLPVIGVAGVTIAVADLDRSLVQYASLLGSEALPVATPTSAALRAARFVVWQSFIELAQPLTSDSPLAFHLEERGEGIHSATLAVGGVAAMSDQLDLALTHGARMLLASA